MATIKEISASSYCSSFPPQRVNDFNVYETTNDRWLWPYGRLGNIRITLEGPERIAAVWVLNTRNGKAGDRATRYIDTQHPRLPVSSYSAPRARLKRYPYWTKIPIAPDGVSAKRRPHLGAQV